MRCCSLAFGAYLKTVTAEFHACKRQYNIPAKCKRARTAALDVGLEDLPAEKASCNLQCRI